MLEHKTRLNLYVLLAVFLIAACDSGGYGEKYSERGNDQYAQKAQLILIKHSKRVNLFESVVWVFKDRLHTLYIFLTVKQHRPETKYKILLL